jgi:hypothetical protein
MARTKSPISPERQRRAWLARHWRSGLMGKLLGRKYENEIDRFFSWFLNSSFLQFTMLEVGQLERTPRG